VLNWLRALSGQRNGESLRETLADLIEQSHDSETSITAGERALLNNILRLRELTAEDVMVPRVDIVAIPEDASLDHLIEQMSGRAHSRLPVYRTGLDDVLGMVHIKDVIGCVGDDHKFSVARILRPVNFVVSSTGVLDLLLEMRQTRRHMALVVDEFGGIDGLITIEDVVEAIVGEIQDEHEDGNGEPDLVACADGTLIADARYALDDFEAEYGATFGEEEHESADTLGGLVFTLAGRVPARGELIRHDSGLEFEILDVDPRTIRRLRLHKVPSPASGTATAGTA
jgi:CBS domain containing-hemolysin-like protein